MKKERQIYYEITLGNGKKATIYEIKTSEFLAIYSEADKMNPAQVILEMFYRFVQLDGIAVTPDTVDDIPISDISEILEVLVSIFTSIKGIANK